MVVSVGLAGKDAAYRADQGSGNRFAAEQQLLQPPQGGIGTQIQRQHAGQRGRHLQMSYIVASDFVGNGAGSLVAVNHYLEAAGQGPEQLQHRDVERDTGDRQPDSGFGSNRPVHAHEKVDDVAVLDHHALGLAGRAGGVHHVGQIPACRLGDNGAGTLARKLAGLGVQLDRMAGAQREARAQIRSRQNHRHCRVFDYPGEALFGKAGVERDIRAAGLQNGQQGDGQHLGAAHGHANQRVWSHPQALQTPGQPIGILIEFPVAQLTRVCRHGNRIRRLRTLQLEQRGDGQVAPVFHIGLVQLKRLSE